MMGTMNERIDHLNAPLTMRCTVKEVVAVFLTTQV